MSLQNQSPFFQTKHALLTQFAAQSSLWQQDAREVLRAFDASDAHARPDDALDVLHRAQRVIRVYLSGLENNPAFRADIEGRIAPRWKDFTSPPVSDALQASLADKLYNVRSNEDIAVLVLGDTARTVGLDLFRRCLAAGVAVDIDFVDPVFATLALRYADEAGIVRHAQWQCGQRMTMTKRMVCQYNMPTFAVPEPDKDKSKIYSKTYEPAQDRVGSGACLYTLTTIPTTRDAELEGIPYPDYLTLYFEMCDQPWDAIRTAQAHLIRQLNKTKMLRFTNSDGTDLSMSIDGFTFCNSVIVKNVPGSEVFSAPQIDSVEGRIVAKGRFPVRDEAGKFARDLTLVFEKGVLREFHAEEGFAEMERYLSTDDGARRVGEIGIGTNPHLTQHVTSTLLAEKISRSFHIALGDAYTMTDYLGDPVRVDNGNRSLIHWDITTMLLGKDGRIYADGNPILQKDAWQDPALRVLNEGWRAVPFDQRPEYWQKKYPEITKKGQIYGL